MKTLESKSKPKQHYDSQQLALILIPFYSQKLYLSATSGFHIWTLDILKKYRYAKFKELGFRSGYWFGWSEQDREIELIKNGGQFKRLKDIYHNGPRPIPVICHLSDPPLSHYPLPLSYKNYLSNINGSSSSTNSVSFAA
jgi:hypothetical protein